MSKYRIKLSNNLILGPYSLDKVQDLIKNKKIQADSLVQEFPLGEWELINFDNFIEYKADDSVVNENNKKSDNFSEDVISEVDKTEGSNQYVEKLDSSNENINNDFKEFSFAKKEVKFSIPDSKKDKLNSEKNQKEDSSKISEDPDDEKTVLLKTKKFKQIEKTVVVNPKEILEETNNSNNKADAIEEIVEEVIEEDIITYDDKTQAINLDQLALTQQLKEAEENNQEFHIQIIESDNEFKEDQNKEEIKEEIVTEVNDEDLKNQQEKEKRKKLIIGLILIVAGYFLFFEEEKVEEKFLTPKFIEISFPVPEEVMDEIISDEKFRMGKKYYLQYLKSMDYQNLTIAINNFQKSLEKKFRQKKIIKNEDGTEKEETSINEAIDYLVLLYSHSFEYVKDDMYAGENFHRLVMLVEPKIYNNVKIAEGVARYYLYFNKLFAARGVVENYLRINKQPSLELFSVYLEILVQIGDFVKAKDLVETLLKQKKLPVDGYLAMSKYFEFNEEKDKVFKVIQDSLKIFPNNSKALLKAVQFLLKEKRFNEIPALLTKVKTNKANFSKILISKYYEYLGLYYAGQEKFPNAIQSFKYSLSIHKNLELQSKLAQLEVGGTDIVEKLILDSKSQILIQKSKDFLKIGELDKALRLAVQASDLSDTFIDSKVYLADVQLKKGLFSSAISMLEKYSKLNNGDLEIEAALVKAYISAYKTDEAFKRLRILSSTKFGEGSEYQYLLGLLYKKEGDFYKSSKSFELSVQINPLFDTGYFELGKIYLSVRKYKYAKDRINKAIQLNPSNPNYVVLYSKILYELNGVDMAIGYLRDQQKNFPNVPIIISQIAQFYYMSGLQKDFERYKEILLSKFSFEPTFFEFLIKEARREGNTKKIEEYSQKYLKFDGSNLDITFNLGRDYLLVGNPKAAETIFLNLNEKLNSFPLINYYLAKTYLDLKDFESAKKYGELEKTLNPNKSNGDSVLGLIAKIQEDYPKAIKHYENAISLNSKDVEALLDLGWIRAKQLEFSRAKDLVTRAKAVEPDNARVYKELGYIYKGMGQSTLAIQFFETYLKMNALGNDKAIIESEINKLKI